MDREVWWATAHRVTKSRTRLKRQICIHTYICIYGYICVCIYIYNFGCLVIKSCPTICIYPVCVCVCVYFLLYIFFPIHTHIHTCTLFSKAFLSKMTLLKQSHFTNLRQPQCAGFLTSGEHGLVVYS